MRRTTLIAVLVSTGAFAALAQDALARGRVYYPGTGGFMQRDPVGTLLEPSMARNLSPAQFTGRDPAAQYADGQNLRQYVRSNPVKRVDPKGLMLGSEWNFALDHPICASRAYKISQTIRTKHQERYGSMEDDTVLNAIYHCVWQCKITKSICCGKDLAKQIGDNHENYVSNDYRQKTMDLHNNEIGRDVAWMPEDSWGHCYQQCEAKAAKKELWWFKPVTMDASHPWNDHARQLIKIIDDNAPMNPPDHDFWYPPVLDLVDFVTWFGTYGRPGTGY